MGLPEIIDCEQGTDAWFQARLGLPTASCFSQVLAKGEGKTRATYMRRLAGEILTSLPAETFRTPEMERGNLMEAEARDAYSFMCDADPERVGFVRNGDIGCSPDSFVGNDGVLEIKTQKAELLIAAIEADKFPAEHVAQCQGSLLVTGRQWVDLCVYWPGMPLFVKRAVRDDVYIETLVGELSKFNRELSAMVDRIRSYGRRAAA